MKNKVKFVLIFTVVTGFISLIASRFIDSNELKKVNLLFNNNFNKLDDKDYQEIQVDKKFDFSNAEKIEINLIGGHVKIMPSSDKLLSVKMKLYSLKGNAFDINQVVKFKNKKITIDSESINSDENKSVFGLFNFSNSQIKFEQNGEIEIGIPQGIQDLDMSVVTANLKIDNLKLDKMSLENVSGNTEILNSYFESMNAETVSGDLKLSETEIKSFTVDSVSGNIRMKYSEIKPIEINFESVSGKANGLNEFHKNAAKSKFKIDTVSGDFEIRTIH